MQTAPEWLQVAALVSVAPQFVLTALIVGIRLYTAGEWLPVEMLALHRRVSKATPPVAAVAVLAMIVMDARRVADIILLLAVVLFFVAPMTYSRQLRRPAPVLAPAHSGSEPEWVLHDGTVPVVLPGQIVQWGIQRTWSDGYTEVVPSLSRTSAEAFSRADREGRASAVVLRVVPGQAPAVRRPQTEPQPLKAAQPR